MAMRFKIKGEINICAQPCTSVNIIRKKMLLFSLILRGQAVVLFLTQTVV